MENTQALRTPLLLDLTALQPHNIYALMQSLATDVDMTLYAVCKKAGVHYTTLHNWKDGTGEPSLRIMRQLVDVIVTAADERGRA